MTKNKADGEPLARARKALANFNIDFTNRMEQERLRQSAALRARIDDEVWALVDKDYSVSAICGFYGTKDWNTVNQIVKRRVVVPVTPEDEAEPEFLVKRDVDNWILVLAFGERVYFQDKGGYPWFNAQDKDFDTTGQLANALRLDAEFYEQVLNMSEVEA